MFAILGASGHTGSVVARSLRAAGKKVRVLARDKSKVASIDAEVVVGHADDAASLDKAFAGAEGAYVLFPPDNATSDLYARNAKLADLYAAALTKAKVPHVVMLSSVGAQLSTGAGPISALHYAEQKLGTLAGTRATFIRAAFFMENLAGMLDAMKHKGVLPCFSTGLEYPFPMIATRDIGETSARALMEPPKQNDVIELVGPKDQSYADAAKLFGAALGKTVTAVSVPFEAVEPTMAGFGVGAHMAKLYREMYEGFNAGKIGYDGKGRRVLGAIDLPSFVKTVVG
jgi:uncharacterized protein YbjT (DUF2867 family)